MSKSTDIAAHVNGNAPMKVGTGRLRGCVQHVASDKIQTSAFGEQKPQGNESTDACWQRDRRVDVGFRTGN